MQLGVKDNCICITDHKATVREWVSDLLFDYQAGSFFQNNNFGLIPLTSYICNDIFPPKRSPTSTHLPLPTHLIDAYCSASLFALTLASHFTKVAGIKLLADSIHFAMHNAELNGLVHKVLFGARDATQIFDTVSDFPPEHTALIVDLPCKGCDEAFVWQPLVFRTQMIVYVSCNVHTHYDFTHMAVDEPDVIPWVLKEEQYVTAPDITRWQVDYGNYR
jgi:tRNA (uracil-5-)-methyltransferase